METDSNQALADEIERLRARIVELEAQLAIQHGTVMGTIEADEPFTVTDAPPSTPRE